MITLFVILPITVLRLGFFRVTPQYLYCGNRGVLALVAGLNLYEVAFCETVKRVDLLSNFLLYPISNGRESVALGLYLDFYSANRVFIVFVISFLVHVYSTSYRSADPRLYLFLTYLTLFTFFRVVLLVSPNYVQLFLGWEGVGLTSYLLVNFWHTRAAANKSALKALIVNRVGDFFLLYFLFLIITANQGIYFVDLGYDRHPLRGLFLVVAASAKSAQLGLHTWLPDAREGPTPVSALIHAATRVTAGIFLLLRSYYLLEDVQPLLLFLGAVTSFFAGSVALFQFDLKRVIAYSTCAQLGYRAVAIAVGSPELSLYHLVNHAYFKALLFLLAGLVIHARLDEQDTRRRGGLLNVLPVTYTLFVVASLALTGFPFLSGYYSKEGILEILYAKQYWFAYFCCLTAAYFTAYYSFRTIYLVFFGQPKGNKPVYLAAAEADTRSLVVVVVLGVFAVLHGFRAKDFFVGLGNTTGWTVPFIEAEFAVPLLIKLLPLGLAFRAVATCVFLEGNFLVLPRWVKLHYFFAKRWWWDFLDSTRTRRFLRKGYYLYVDLERGLLEWVGPRGIRLAVGRVYELFRSRGWFPSFFTARAFGFVFLGVAAWCVYPDEVGAIFFSFKK